MNKLAIGTAQFGFDYGVANLNGAVSFIEGEAILNVAKKNDINFLDTAIAYGDSERNLGLIGIDEFQVITKLPELPVEIQNNPRVWVKEQVIASFKRLNVNNVYGLLLHRPEQLLGIYGNELFNTLQELKVSGLISKVGISIYEPEDIKKICSQFDIDIIQLPLNILDKRWSDKGYLKYLRDKNIEIHIRSIFLQGLLLMPYDKLPEKFNHWNATWKIWNKWLIDNNISALEACIRYVLSINEISKIVIGVDSKEQLEEILKASKGTLPKLPSALQIRDVNLLNPAKWEGL